MEKLIFKCPINNVSFGNVSLNLMRELYKRNIQVAHFPIGNPDASVYDKIDKDNKNATPYTTNIIGNPAINS